MSTFNQLLSSVIAGGLTYEQNREAAKTSRANFAAQLANQTQLARERITANASKFKAAIFVAGAVIVAVAVYGKNRKKR